MKTTAIRDNSRVNALEAAGIGFLIWFCSILGAGWFVRRLYGDLIAGITAAILLATFLIAFLGVLQIRSVYSEDGKP